MNNKPKILYFSDCHYFSGSERPLIKFFESDELNYSFELVFSYRYSDTYETQLLQRVQPTFKVYPLSLSDKFYPRRDKRFNHLPLVFTQLSRLFSLSFALPLFYIYDFIKLRNLIKSIRPNILHINNGGYPGSRSARIAALVAAGIGNIKVVMVVNNQPVGYTNWPRRFGYVLDRMVARVTSLFISGSIQVTDKLNFLLKLDPNQGRTIANCSALEQISESAESVKHRLLDGGAPTPYVFLAVGVLEERKGHHLIVEAAAELIRANPSMRGQFVVWIEGIGSQLNFLESLIIELEMGGTVQLLGSEKNIASIINAADCFVHPSLYDEDFPQVTVEAMSIGKPIIANKIAGLSQQVDNNVTGILVEQFDSRAWAKAMDFAVSNPDRLSEWGLNGIRKYRSSFTAKIIVNRYLEIYRYLLD